MPKEVKKNGVWVFLNKKCILNCFLETAASCVMTSRCLGWVIDRWQINPSITWQLCLLNNSLAGYRPQITGHLPSLHSLILFSANMSRRRCVLGCTSGFDCLFSFPKTPWLRARWMEFIHFEEGGILENSRLCSRHFTVDSFLNHGQVRMGFAAPSHLALQENAIPTVYTVGASPPLRVSTLANFHNIICCLTMLANKQKHVCGVRIM